MVVRMADAYPDGGLGGQGGGGGGGGGGAARFQEMYVQRHNNVR